MAFFSAVSSSIGRKLLLYGLRHIDILDKDPADFVSVDVGKRTTLEVRDVGLHVKVSCHGRTHRETLLTNPLETCHATPPELTA
jgi:autophagy-related protein 2